MLKHRCEEMKRNRVYKANISELILDKNPFQVFFTNLFHSWGWPSFSCTSSFLWPVCLANAFWCSILFVWFDFSLMSYFLFSATIDEGENETNDSSDDVDAIKCKTNKVKQLRLDVENLRKFISDQYAEDIGNNCRMQWVSEPVNLALPTKLTHAPS